MGFKGLTYISPEEYEKGEYTKPTAEQWTKITHFTMIPHENGWDEVIYLCKKSPLEKQLDTLKQS